jgi:hypothetical protein
MKYFPTFLISNKSLKNIFMDILVRGSNSSATTSAKNYHNYAIPFLSLKLIVVEKCTIWRQKLLFISFFEMYQHHAHLLWDERGGGEGGGRFLKCPHKPFLSDILFTDIYSFFMRTHRSLNMVGVRDRKTGRFKLD